MLQREGHVPTRVFEADLMLDLDGRHHDILGTH